MRDRRSGMRRLRAELSKVRESGEEMSDESGELNLVPFLDIIMNIIIFLLATVTFQAALANINITLPTAAMASSAPATPKPELNLTVSISERGYTIATSGAVLFRGAALLGAEANKTPQKAAQSSIKRKCCGRACSPPISRQ